MSRDAARLGGDHQPGQRADPRRPHARRAVRGDGAPPGAAARRRQLRLGARLREGPARPASRSTPLPSLFIVVDEFSEMLSAKPEFIDLFVAIGRLGRSLSIHLLLASQRLEEGRLRGLESHLSYRVGLRTFSAQESRAVLGVPDAYELPGVPGLGYLKPDPTIDAALQGRLRLRPAVGSHPRAPRRGRQDRGHPALHRLGGAEARPGRARAGAAPGRRRRESGDQDSLLDIAVQRMVGHGPAAHQVWLPPLDVPDTLDELLPDLAEDPELGLVSREWRKLGGLVRRRSAPSTGRASSAATRSRSTSAAPPATSPSSAGPRTGKSTLLRTDRGQHVADHDAAGVAVLRPRLRRRHVHPAAPTCPTSPGVGTRSEPDVVRRIVAEVAGIVDRREAYFRAHAIDSIETYRTPAGRGPRRRRLRRRVPRHRRLEHAARRLRRPRGRRSSSWPRAA